MVHCCGSRAEPTLCCAVRLHQTLRLRPADELELADGQLEVLGEVVEY